MSFHAFAARSLFFLALAGGAATPALAQRVISDNEAGKLTLDALTATPAPVVHRVVYRPASHRVVASRASAHSHNASRAAVHTVAYRHAGRAPVAKPAARHGKARRG